VESEDISIDCDCSRTGFQGQTCTEEIKGSANQTSVAIAGLTAGIVILILFVVLVLFLCRRKTSQREGMEEPFLPKSGCSLSLSLPASFPK